MTASIYNMAAMLAQTQFGQGLYATFQATDDLGRSRRVRGSAGETRLAHESVEQIRKPKAPDDIRIDEDARNRNGNFTEMFDKMRKRFEQDRSFRLRRKGSYGGQAGDGRSGDFHGQPGCNVDFIA